MVQGMVVTGSRFDREWKEWDLSQVTGLLLRFNRLPQASQMAVLLELELLWEEDLGEATAVVMPRCVQRAQEYGLLWLWLHAVQHAEIGDVL